MKDKILNLYNKYDLGFFMSVISLFIIATIHLILSFISFSWYMLCYAIFSYIFMLGRIIIYFLCKNNKYLKILYFTSAIILFLALTPLSITVVKTLTDKELYEFYFGWMIYGYALYAFIKLSIAIYGIIHNKGTRNERNKIYSSMSLISATFTMFMLEFTMIRTFDKSEALDTNIKYMEFSFQIIVILLTFLIAINFIIKHFLVLKIIKNDEITT